jgi:hypothetical protein
MGCVVQIFNMLSSLNIDFHPDAHAVRLKFSLATMASSMALPWDPCKELECYVRKVTSRARRACELPLTWMTILRIDSRSTGGGI